MGTISMAPPKPQVWTIDDLEAYASQHLPKMVRDYYNGGSMDSITLNANIESYRQWYITPRVLRDVSKLDTSVSIFAGERVSFPCCVAPAAMQKMAHPEGEEATARAAGSKGVVMGLSSFSTTSLEDVQVAADKGARMARSGRSGICVLQMYLFENRAVSETLVQRAEKAGFKAIVLTVDTPYFGRRLSELQNGFKLPPHLKMANFDDSLGVKTGSHIRTEERQTTSLGDVNDAKEQHRVHEKQSMSTMAAPPANKNDPSLTWDVVDYLKSVTKLPIYLKGILTASDAQLAVQHGADGIIVSNHGGRQLDGAPPTLEVLPDVVEAVRGRIPVHFDGGIRRGSDIFKALCFGADMCWIGRPALWGLAYDGENGVKLALDILEEEFRACMALAGFKNVAEVKREGTQILQSVRTRESRLLSSGTARKRSPRIPKASRL